MKKIFFILIIFTKMAGAQSAWVSQYSNITNHLYSVSFTDSLKGWACGQNAFIKTTNGGDNWMSVQGIPAQNFVYMKVFNADTAYLFSYSGLLYKTYNGWNNFSSSYAPCVNVSFVNLNTGWGHNGIFVFKTTNGGNTWSEIYTVSSGIIRAISFTDLNTGFIGREYSNPPFYNCYADKTINGGVNWTNSFNITLATKLYNLHFFNQNTGIVAGELYSGYFHSMTFNGGNSWGTPISSMIPIRTISPAGQNDIWVAGLNAIFYSNNGGESFVNHSALFALINSMYFVSHLRGWMVCNNGKIFRTTTGANKVPDAPVLSAPINGDTNVKVNAACSWNYVTLATGYRIQIAGDSLFASIVVDSSNISSNSFRVPSGFLNYGTPYYWRVNSANNFGSGSWSEIRKFRTSWFPSSPLLISPPFNANNISLTPELVWENLGQSIIQYHLQVSTNYVYTNILLDSAGITEVSISVPSGLLTYNTQYFWRVRALNSYGWGSYSLNGLFRTIVSNIKIISSEIPTEFKLFSNYPNPFNSSTSVKFQVPSLKFIKLVVFDLLGREVKTLVNEVLRPGTYNVSFDAGDLPSGIYFYQMRSNDFSETKKLILLK